MARIVCGAERSRRTPQASELTRLRCSFKNQLERLVWMLARKHPDKTLSVFQQLRGTATKILLSQRQSMFAGSAVWIAGGHCSPAGASIKPLF
jgi:hypothetical protein